ncbi:MAG: aminotransferase class I/II-fold pyridoxal phosphate-dependent enzyme [Clostridia bacterium]|nr:aminotransferase class I/II-fold pyridoxal phosphate-dependent enzyme [Clostridia bacterium]
MLFFVNDYCEGAHENILKRMTLDNYFKNPGYGSDPVCESARQKIRNACKKNDADVFFISGGTQTNQLIIDTCLNPYEGVVAVETGHIALHEAGAVESTGHKVLTLPAHEGKMDARELRNYVKSFYEDENHEHMVFPGMVYISQPTEYGSLYGKAELKALRSVCDEFKMKLFVDGARLAYALGARGNDVTLPILAQMADVFYIGGTKCGALFGEAVVFAQMKAPPHFLTQIKQHGALLAKGWLLGMQFDELFENDLYTTLGARADAMADRLRYRLIDRGYKLLIETPTNQVLVVLDNRVMKALSKRVRFSFWEVIDKTHTAVRFCTSWATKEEDLKELMNIL